MNNYIVRVCRFKKDSPRNLVGVIEEIGVKGKKAFMNYDELWEILNLSEKRSAPKAKGKGRKRSLKNKIEH